MEFDETPAVALSSNPFSAGNEFADENEDQSDDFSALSLEQLLVHSNWKARKEGLERIAKDTSLVATYVTLLPRLAKETNTAAQEQLFETSSSLVESGALSDVEMKEVAQHLLKPVMEKGITGRPKAAQVSVQLLSSLTANALHEEVAHAILHALTHKTPKNRQMALTACATMVKEFGLSHLPAKTILKAVSPLFNDANPLVRKEAQSVFCQCYRYLGANIKAFLGDLREVQAAEMMKTFEELQVGQPPEKSIKGFEQVSARSKQVAVLSSTSLAADAELDDETFAMLDETMVLGKLGKTFFSVASDKSLKWVDRCAMVKDNLCALIAPPKRLRTADDYHELFKLIRELFLDPQAPLMLVAITALQHMCKGLRQAAAPYVRQFIGPVFEKMKDKKTSVCEHMFATLNVMLKSKCVTLEVLHDEIEAVAMTSKVPNQRSALVQWLSLSCIEAVDTQQFSRLLRAAPMFAKLAADEKVEVREGTLQLISKMVQRFGDKSLQPILSSLDAKQLSRVVGTSTLDQSLHGKQGSSSQLNICGESPSGQSPMKKVARVEKSGPAGGLVKALSASTLSNAQSRKLSNAGPMSSSSSGLPRSAPSSAAASSTTTPQHQHDDPVALESAMPSKDDAYAKISSLLSEDSDILGPLSSKEWKQRFEATQKLAEVIASSWSEDMCTQNLEHVVVLLKNEPVWKDSIFQVINAVIHALSECVKKASSISQRCAYVLIQGFLSRFTEPKCKLPARDLLSTVAEGATPKFVIKHSIAAVLLAKNPKLTQEANEWIAKLLAEFDGTTIDAKALIDYVKNYCFEQTQPQVKTSAIPILVQLRSRMGANKLDVFLSDLNPHLKSAVDVEFGKGVSPQASQGPITTRQLKAAAAAPALLSSVPSSLRGSAMPASSRAAHDNEEDFPRADVSGALALAVRDITGGKDWKVRSAGIKKIEEVVNGSHKHILGIGVSDTLKALRTRFDESNKNMVVDSLRVISLLMESADAAACRLGLKAILPAVFALLGDQKANLREEATKVCHTGVRWVGLDVALPMMLRSLTSEALGPRQIAVDILDKCLIEMQSQSDANKQTAAIMHRPLWMPVVPVLLKLAMDRAGDIRLAAERIVGVVLPIVGVELFSKHLMDLKPAEQQHVRPMLERQLAASAALSPVSSNQQAPAQPAQALAAPQSAPQLVASNPESVSRPATASNRLGTAASGGVSVLSLQQHPLPLLRPQTASVPSAARPHGASTAVSDLDVPLAPNEIILGLRSAASATAFRMCTDFMKRFRKGEDCGSIEMMHAMIDRLQESTVLLDSDLALGLINCLSAMFSSPRAALRCDTATLVSMFRSVFSCLLSEQFSQSDTVIRSVNSMTLKMLEGCQINEVFAALLALLGEYSAAYLETNSKLEHKSVQVVVKCLMRLETEQVAPDVVIVSCHDYLLQHPPSAFRNRDDLSIRTIKTILQAVSRKYGKDLLATADRLVGPQNLVSHFIKACLESKEKALRARMEEEAAATAAAARDSLPSSASPISSSTDSNPSAQQLDATSKASFDSTASQSNQGSSTLLCAPTPTAQLPSAASTSFAVPPQPTGAVGRPQQPNAPESVPMLGNVAPNVHAAVSTTMTRPEESKPVSNIFSKIRNHVTSNQGVEELYAYLKEAPTCPEFVLQFNKCSDAFRSFIKRRLERVLAEDSSRPAGFKFPEVVLLTP